ncbi:MAG: hypothetical protein HYZ65_01865 [Burkholderiales bacterium]|nr:hypothetical protein [Burkholderiales bacterium]
MDIAVSLGKHGFILIARTIAILVFPAQYSIRFWLSLSTDIGAYKKRQGKALFSSLAPCQKIHAKMRVLVPENMFIFLVFLILPP